jgi:hypothetical protein
MLPSLAEIKKALVAAGFELYRTRGDEVHVADRVRDNLIMDSGVSVRAKGSLSVRFVARAQRSDFPSDGPASLFEKARGLGVIAEARGYAETGSATSSIQDPADPNHTLDVWYEVAYEKGVASLEEAMLEVGFVLKIDKTARVIARST